MFNGKFFVEYIQNKLDTSAPLGIKTKNELYIGSIFSHDKIM